MQKCKRPACTNTCKPCYNKKRNGPIAGPCEKGTSPAMENSKVFALLIDAENVSPKYIKTIIDEVSMYGTPAYKRIYGDWTSPDMASWKKVLLEHNLTPIQQFSYTQGKNASDSAMIIDAMDVLYAGNVDGFCLVSSDSDFTRLAARLRESRMFVIGMGESKTPTAFKAACDTFKYLDQRPQKSSPRGRPKSRRKRQSPPRRTRKRRKRPKSPRRTPGPPSRTTTKSWPPPLCRWTKLWRKCARL